jgi:hypothetical protein
MDAEWRITENRRRAKYCGLTAGGRRELGIANAATVLLFESCTHEFGRY